MPHVFSPLGKLKENSEKLKWLLDTLDTIAMCPSPVLGIHLVASLCSLWLPSECEFLFNQKNLSWIGNITYKIDSEGSEVYAPGEEGCII